MQNIKLIKGRKTAQELHGLSDTKNLRVGRFEKTLLGGPSGPGPLIYLCLDVDGVTGGRDKEGTACPPTSGGLDLGVTFIPVPHSTVLLKKRESRWWEVAWPSPGVLLRNAGGKLEQRKRGAFQLGGDVH